MRNVFHPDSTLYRLLSTVSDLVLLNILTILCSIPIITVGAASTALYYTVEKMQKHEGNLFRAYFRSFKENFRQTTLLWLFLLVIAAAIGFCILFCRATGITLVLIIAGIALLVWCAVVSWLFPLTAKFYFPTRSAIRNAVLCAIAYWPVSLLMIVTNFLPYGLLIFTPTSFLQIGFIWLVIWFAAAAFCNLQLLKKPFELLAQANDIE